MVRRLSQLLMIAGVMLGLAVALAMLANWGWPGASWLVNVALAKLTLVAAAGLLAAGAITGRIAKRRDVQSNASRTAV